MRVTGFEPALLSEMEPKSIASAVPPHPRIQFFIFICQQEQENKHTFVKLIQFGASASSAILTHIQLLISNYQQALKWNPQSSALI